MWIRVGGVCLRGRWRGRGMSEGAQGREGLACTPRNSCADALVGRQGKAGMLTSSPVSSVQRLARTKYVGVGRLCTALVGCAPL